MAPVDVMGSLVGQGGPGCPGLDSRGKHRMFFSGDWSTARMWHWDNACRWQNDSAGKYQPPPAIEEMVPLWHRGTTFIKGDRCLGKERINSFVFDFGDVRLDLPCSLHQSCSCPLGTTGGEEEAELVISPLSLGCYCISRGCRAKTPLPGTKATRICLMKLPRC